MVYAYKRRRYARRGIGRVSGRGSYFTDRMRDLGVGNILRDGGAMAGTGLGGYFGGPVGAMVGGHIGRGLGGAISKVSGMGAYTVKKNAFKVHEGYQLPSFGDLSQAIVITHREYIGDVAVPSPNPTAFINTPFVLNPGIAATFPWLSNIAKSFDQYQWLGLIFEFKSTTADVGSVNNLGMGTVIMSTDYDAGDPPFASKIEMENNQYTCSTKPSASIYHAVECDPKVTVQSKLYCRSGPLTANSQDVRFYDHGIFQIATQGLPAGTSGTLGELWCTYKVAFYKPQLHNNQQLTDKFTGLTSLSQTNPMGTAPFADPSNSLGCSLVTGGPGVVISFPASARVVGDEYLIVYMVTGNATAITSGIVCTGLGVDDVTGEGNGGATSATRATRWAIIRCASTTAMSYTIGTNAWTIPTSPTIANLYITKLDPRISYP